MKTLNDLLQAIAQLDTENFEKPQFLIAQVLKFKRQYAKEHGLAEVPTNSELLQLYRTALADDNFPRSQFIEKILTKRGVRSQSGIVPIQVLTKPFRCPGECIFCPNDASMPKSYINTEPGAMRALLNQFDPYKQAYNRLLSLYLTGHSTDKIEMIVLGGTWDVYPTEYKRDFLKWLYDACNTFDQFMLKVNMDDDNRAVRYNIDELGIEYPETIQESMKINESAQHRIIGLTIETRPEYMTDENCRMWREWWVTRLEMWLQSMYDDVLDANKRGHSVQQAREAVHKMRQYGFKFSIHFMPWLYGSTSEKDIESFRLAYSDPWILPDEIKFYPTSVIPNTELYELYKKGDYKPLAGPELVRIIKEVQRNIIPPYTRIKRLIRDIPSTEIVAGNDVTNLRQLTENQMLAENQSSEELRHTMYSRMYPNCTYYKTIEEMLIDIKKNPKNTTAAWSQWHDNTPDWQEATQLSWVHPSGDRPKDDFIEQCSNDGYMIASVDWQYTENNQQLLLQVDNYKTYIVGQKIDLTTMRQFIALDTRAREMRHRTEWQTEYINLVVREYASSAWQEYFVSFEDELGYIYGFTRLLLPDADKTIAWEWLGVWTALIRELHVYGQVAKITTNVVTVADKTNTAQHKWFGSQLMAAAERIAEQAWYQRLSVISGIWVKAYYHKLGYSDEGTYVVKEL